MSDSLSLGSAAFDALLRPFAPPAAIIALAVSGGSDSMALALCAARWAKENQRRCIALIVDHALRPESAIEALTVQRRLEKIGLQSEILRWDHGAVTSGIHKQARAARYHLLITACHRHGAGDLWIGHHRDDQAETILMRLSKGSGIEGLGGMAAEKRRDGVRLLRPFLTIGKDRLIATCIANKIDFVTDPSNASASFARGRLRAIMPLLEPEGLSIDRLIDLGARAAEAQQALAYYTLGFLQDAAVCGLDGAIRIDRAKLSAQPRAIAVQAIGDCLRLIHRGDYAPERASLLALVEQLSGHKDELTASLHGCLIGATAREITVLREPAAADSSIAFIPGGETVWDDRWIVSGMPPVYTTQTPHVIRALGNPPHDALDQLAPGLRHAVPQGRVRATVPALWRKNENDAAYELCAIPALNDSSPFQARLKNRDFPKAEK